MARSSLSMVTKTACLILISMMMMIMAADAAVARRMMPCPQVITTLMPCLNYLKKGGAIPVTCCDGVKKLANSAKTQPDRQAACVCLKPAAKSYGINYDLANKLPASCGIDYQINLSPDIDCTRFIYMLYIFTIPL